MSPSLRVHLQSTWTPFNGLLLDVKYIIPQTALFPRINVWVILELWRNGIPWASNRKGMEPGPNDISMTKIPRELWNVCCVICDLGVRICDCEPSCDNVWHSSVTMYDTALWQCVTQLCDNVWHSSVTMCDTALWQWHNWWLGMPDSQGTRWGSTIKIYGT